MEVLIGIVLAVIAALLYNRNKEQGLRGEVDQKLNEKKEGIAKNEEELNKLRNEANSSLESYREWKRRNGIKRE